jgi:hypothetical protein
MKRRVGPHRHCTVSLFAWTCTNMAQRSDLARDALCMKSATVSKPCPGNPLALSAANIKGELLVPALRQSCQCNYKRKGKARRRDFRNGSSTDLFTPKSDFRFTPEIGLKSDIA